MRAIAVVVTLKEGADDDARALVESGPPFALEEAGFERHEVYLGPREVVFVFAGEEVEWALDDLTSDYFHPDLRRALEAWGPLVEGAPRIAERVFVWSN